MGAPATAEPDLVPHGRGWGTEPGWCDRSSPISVPSAAGPGVVHRAYARKRHHARSGNTWCMEPWYPCCPPVFGLTPPVRAGGEDGPTPDMTRGPRWRTSSQGLHVPVDVDLTIEQRIIEAATRLPDRGMVTGWAALRLAGVAYFEGRQRDVPVLLPHSSRIRAPGLEVSRTRRALPTPEVCYGVPCAPLAAALIHELRLEQDVRELVVMIEMALLARAVTRREVREALESAPRMHTRHFNALEMATGDCRSPPEVRMMLTWRLDAGFPSPLMNREVLDRAGRRLAVVDLLDTESGSYGEYDGEAHRDRARHRRDVERAEALREVGLEGFTVVAGDSVDVQVARMRSARRRALWLPEGSRAWRVGPHVPMSRLTRPLSSDELQLLRSQEPPPDDWGTR